MEKLSNTSNILIISCTMLTTYTTENNSDIIINNNNYDNKLLIQPNNALIFNIHNILSNLNIIKLITTKFKIIMDMNRTQNKQSNNNIRIYFKKICHKCSF